MSLVAHAEIRALLDRLGALEDQLNPGEREMYHALVETYAVPTQGDPHDRTCIEVILRNIEVRRQLGMAGADATRSIDLPHADEKPD
ncbi:MAG: hypothetical protein AAGJ70_01490 [Pseudomonadota bacterium]